MSEKDKKGAPPGGEKKPAKKNAPGGKKQPDIIAKFNKLHPAAKVGIVAGAGLLLFLVFRSLGSKRTSSGDALIYLPSGEAVSGTSGGGSSGGGSSYSGSSEYYNRGYIEGYTIGAVETTRNQEQQQSLWEQMMNSLSGLFGAGNANQGGGTSALSGAAAGAGYSDYAYEEGGIQYQGRLYDDGSKDIWKDGRLIPEENYQYIPQQVGGTRDDSPQREILLITYGNNYSDLDRELQLAQLNWGLAGDQAQRDYYASEGQRLRAEGATDQGALYAWEAYNAGIY